MKILVDTTDWNNPVYYDATTEAALQENAYKLLKQRWEKKDEPENFICLKQLQIYEEASNELFESLTPRLKQFELEIRDHNEREKKRGIEFSKKFKETEKELKNPKGRAYELLKYWDWDGNFEVKVVK